MSWSSGKDSAFALHAAREAGFAVNCLLTTVDAETARVPVHGIHTELVRAQARALGLRTVPNPYVLRLAVDPPEQWRGGLVGILKPLADGIASAIHTHSGPIDNITGRAATVDPHLSTEEFARLLTEPREAGPGSTGEPPMTNRQDWCHVRCRNVVTLGCRGQTRR